MMDTARQIIRWSIPGSVSTIALLTFQGLTAIAWGYTPGQLLTSSVVQGVTPAIAALMVTSSVPLGFVVYQVYYALYGNILPFHFVNKDRGADILTALPPATVTQLIFVTGAQPDYEEIMYEEIHLPLFGNPLLRLKRRYRNRAGRRRYIDKQQVNRNIVRAYLDFVCMQTKSSDLKQEFTTLSDIYHAIGASRTALFLAYVGYLLSSIVIHHQRWMQQPCQMAITTLCISFFAFILFRVLERTRTQTWLSAQATLRYGLRWYALRHEEEQRVNALAQEQTNNADILSR